MTVSVAGSFHYYVASGADPGPLCDGYLSVDPELPRGLALDSLVCQTVLAKLLGPLASWRDKLEVAYRWVTVTCHTSHVTPECDCGLDCVKATLSVTSNSLHMFRDI